MVLASAGFMADQLHRSRKCAPHMSCILSAIIGGQATATMCRSAGIGRLGSCTVTGEFVPLLVTR